MCSLWNRSSVGRAGDCGGLQVKLLGSNPKFPKVITGSRVRVTPSEPNGNVAQLEAQRSLTPLVAGSTPVISTAMMPRSPLGHWDQVRCK